LPDAEAKALTNGVHPEDLMINRRPLAELDRADCHWPIGDPRDVNFGFCGAAVVAGRPYCARHTARAYQRAA
jgi:GcrA cell cycle regulator